MSHALAQLPPRYRNVPSIEKMAASLDRYRGRSRSLKDKAADGMGLVEGAAATGIGAALAGWAMGKGYEPMTVAAGGGALLALGVVQRSPVMVEAAKGVLAPLVALWAMRQAQSGGNNASAHEAAAGG